MNDTMTCTQTCSRKHESEGSEYWQETALLKAKVSELDPQWFQQLD